MSSHVSKITFCYQFGYHKKPFIHGVRDGKDVIMGYACERLPDGYAISINMEYGNAWIDLEYEGEEVDGEMFDEHEDSASIVMAMVNYACGMADLEKSFDDEVLGE